jgi:hypothetical protein
VLKPGDGQEAFFRLGDAKRRQGSHPRDQACFFVGRHGRHALDEFLLAGNDADRRTLGKLPQIFLPFDR